MPVPDNATALDQLIAFTGRNPAMTSPNTIKRVIDVDGAVLHADTRWGATPALVFLHYWGGSRRTWRPVLARLQPDQAFVNYDQRGWGDSVDAPGPYDIQRLADDAQSVVATSGHSDYVLVGHSMGGKVARRDAGLPARQYAAVFPANECEAWLAERAVDASSDVEKHRSVHAEGLARTRRAPASLQALHHDHRGRQRGALRLSAESRTR